MKLITLLCLASFAAQAEPNYNRIADAIYKVEGGAKTKWAYGVHFGANLKHPANARKVCLNTIKNNYQRWQASGAHGSFIDFLARRYCPPNYHWWAGAVKGKL
jgi:hypothetical protein